MWRRSLLLSIVALLGTAPPAAAEDPLPAIHQYVEQIPTSSGSSEPASEAVVPGNAATPHLSAPAEESLEEQGGRDESALRRIATEPSLGAPQETLPQRNADDAVAMKEASQARSRPTSEAFAALDLGGGGGKRLPALTAVLILLTPLLLVAGRQRAKRR